MEFSYLILLIAIALAAYLLRLLSIVGTITAFLIGLALMFFGGPNWFFTLLLFFVSSNILTKFSSKNKKKANKVVEKGDQSRDALQVFANSLFMVCLSVIFFLIKDNKDYSDLISIAFLGAVASVSADTAATEIGILSKKKPLMLTDLKPITKGLSGGVSIQGLLGSVLGAAIIAIGGLVLFPNLNPVALLFSITFAGFIGAFFDSLLGALLQAAYHCPKCKTFTELQVHTCKTKTVLVKGAPFFSNDVVNILSSIAGSIVAIIAFLAFQVKF